MTQGEPIAGQQYTIFCTVVFPVGLTSPISVQWYNSGGLISNSSEITVRAPLILELNITSSIHFNPLRTSHGDQFSCRAALTSPAPPFSLTRSVDVDIIVEGGFIYSLVSLDSIVIVNNVHVQLELSYKLISRAAQSLMLEYTQQGHLLSLHVKLVGGLHL